MKAAARAAVAVAVAGVLCIVGAFAVGLVAIWTVGPNSGRLGATALVLFFVGVVLAVVGGIAAVES